MKPRTSPSAPAGVARMRYIPPNASAPISGRRTAGSAIETRKQTKLSARATVRPTRAAAPVLTVVARSRCAKKKIMYAETATSGTRSAIEITTTRATSEVILRMRAARSGDSVSSSRSSSVAFMLNDRYRRRADAHQLVGWMIERDPDGKALRDAHPVEVARDGRHAGDGEVLRLRDGRADAFDDALQTDLGRHHHVRSRALAGAHALELGLAKVRDDVPRGCVDQREQRPHGVDQLTDGRGHPDDAAIERRAHDGVAQIALGLPDQRARPLEFCQKRVGVADGLEALLRRGLRTLELTFRGGLVRARQIDLLRRDVALRQERLE